jgi:hypothetical protein
MYPQPMGYPQQYYGGYPQAYNPYYGYPRNPYYSYVPPSVPVNYYYQTMSPITGTMPVAPTTPAAPPVMAPVPAAPMLPAPVTPPATTINSDPPVVITPAPIAENSTPLMTPRVAQPLPSSPAVPKFFVKDSGPVSPGVSLPDPSNCTPQGACTECIKQDCCNNCCCPRLWFDAEYLMWWFKNAPDPVPFVQSSPLFVNTNIPLPPLPTIPAIGGTDIDTGIRYGGRFRFGGWLDSDCTLGLEASYFFITPKESSQSLTAAGPAAFFGAASYLLLPAGTVNIPGFGPVNTFLLENGSPGSSAINTLTLRSDLFGFEANGIFKLINCPRFELKLLGGFRNLNFDESLAYSASFTGGSLFVSAQNGAGFNGAGLPGTVAASYSDQNHFYGGNLGTAGEVRLGGFFLNATGKVALGTMQESFTQSVVSTTPAIDGVGFNGVFLSTPGPFASTQHYSVNRFAVIPEVNVNVGYQFARWCRAYAGYDFLYVSDVLRPGLQVSSAPVLTNPPALQQHSTFWAQGANFGLEFRF